MRDFYREQFNNGLTLMAYPMLSTHSVTILLYLRGGVNWETKEEMGITHMVEHLCFRRCNGLSQTDFYKRIGAIGGFLGGATYRDHVIFSLSIHPHFTREAVEIMASLFEENYWTYEDIRKEKEVVYRQIEGDFYSFERNLDNSYYSLDGKSKPIMGSVGRVRKFTKPQLEAWKRLLIQPSNSGIIIAGAFLETDLEVARSRFAELTSNREPPRNTVLLPQNFLHRTEADDLLKYDEYHTTEVGIVFDLDKSKTSFELDLLRNTMSSGMYSPLAMLLREEYGILHEIPTLWDLSSFGGNLLFTFEVENEYTDLLMEGIVKQFTEAKVKLNRDAFEYAKSYLTMGQIALLQDNPEEYARLLGDYAFLKGEKFDTLESFSYGYAAISFEQLCSTANCIFSAKNLSITAITDATKYDRHRSKKMVSAIRKSLE